MTPFRLLRAVGPVYQFHHTALHDTSLSRYRLVLVDVTGKQEVSPLTGWTGTLTRPNWMPVLTTEP